MSTSFTILLSYKLKQEGRKHSRMSHPVCLVCFRVIKKLPEKVKNCGQVDTLHQFVIFSERFLELPETVLSSIKSIASGKAPNSHFCLDCENLISRTCQLYQDLCSIQIKLGWRLKLLEKLLEGDGRLSSKLCALLGKRVAAQLNISQGSQHVGHIRRTISRRCRQTRCVQKEVSITLERIPQSQAASSFVVTSQTDDELEVAVEARAQDSTSFSDKNDFLDHLVKVEQMDDFASLNFDTGEADDYSDFDITNQIQDEYEEAEKEVPIKLEAKLETSLLRVRQLRTVSKARGRGRPRKYPKKSVDTSVTPSLSDVPVPKPTRRPRRRAIAKDAVLDPSELTCQVCLPRHYQTKTIDLLKAHLTRRHESKWERNQKNKGKRRPFQCYFCQHAFAYKQSLHVHLMRTMHIPSMTRGRFICGEGECDNLMFNSFKELNAHFVKDHCDETIVRCSLCAWPFLSESMKEVHEFTHLFRTDGPDGETMKCPKCNEKKFGYLGGLQHHYITVHTSLKLKTYKCTLCTEQFKAPDTYSDHMAQHENERLVSLGLAQPKDDGICGECGKSFPNGTRLDAHFPRVHLQKTQCPECGKLVPPHRMRRHVAVFHRKREPVPCPICVHISVDAHELRKHLRRVHPNQQRSRDSDQCHLCPKKYQRRGLLRRHLKDVHKISEGPSQMELPFVCSECGNRYRYKSSLDQHVDAKHTAEDERRWVHRCTLCSRSFWRKCLLEKHIEEVHNKLAQEQPVWLGPIADTKLDV